LEIASWTLRSIWLIEYRSARRCMTSSEAELELDPPQAESEITITSTASAPPVSSVRILRPFLAFVDVARRGDVLTLG